MNGPQRRYVQLRAEDGGGECTLYLLPGEEPPAGSHCEQDETVTVEHIQVAPDGVGYIVSIGTRHRFIPASRELWADYVTREEEPMQEA